MISMGSPYAAGVDTWAAPPVLGLETGARVVGQPATIVERCVHAVEQIYLAHLLHVGRA